MRSMTSALRRKIFSRASSRCTVPCVSGAASASAHGHATIKTEVNAFSDLPVAEKPKHRRRQRHADDEFCEALAVTVRERVEVVVAHFAERLVVPERRQIALCHGLDRLDFNRAADLPPAGVKMFSDFAPPPVRLRR